MIDLAKFDKTSFSDAERRGVLDDLVSGNYVGALSLLIAGSNYWFGENFQITNGNPPMWRVRIGDYNGAWQVHGYWIFRPAIYQCWQAYNYGSPFRYWNEDGTQHEPNDRPQDWEIFRFEWANQGAGTVRIRQGRSGNYVGLTDNQFNLDAGQFVDKAAVFQCAFGPGLFGPGASKFLQEVSK
jgi:hypothetical protein